MTDLRLPEALLEPRAYPHAVDSVQRVETHLSWVFLTGSVAYKVKKPVKLDFVDFSRLEDRERFCRKEFELNCRFAPDIYLGVVPVVAESAQLRIGGPGETDVDHVVDWAVQMRQFPADQECGALVSNNRLNVQDLRDFGARIAQQHAELPHVSASSIDTAVMDNFATLEQISLPENLKAKVSRLRQLARSALDQQAPLMAYRTDNGKVRRCHGDLHLGNLVKLDGQITAFDCLEFSDALSTIDVWADAAFLFMDLCFKERTDLAYAFIDGYLDTSGDYSGAVLLPLFAQYRALVRAKVAGLRYAQTQKDSDLQDVEDHLDWALTRAERTSGPLIFTHGLSGSGKSYWAAQLASALPAIRFRSDVLRKVLAGIPAAAHTQSAVGGGQYSKGKSEETYRAIAELAVSLATQGETVIIDAANLFAWQRKLLRQAAEDAGVHHILLSFTAPESVLRHRIDTRQQSGRDPSEADGNVLNWQLQNSEAITPEEHAIFFDTSHGKLSGLTQLLTHRVSMK